MSDNDRATRESIADFLSDTGSGESVRAVSDDVDRPARTRNLRATFRAVPSAGGSDPGFPGTSTFAPHRSDGRALGSTVEPAGTGSDQASAPAQSADDAARRNATIQAAIDRAVGKRSVLPADQGTTSGRVRGWRGPSGAKSAAVGAAASGAGSRAKKEKPAPASALPKAIVKLVPKDGQVSPPSPSKLIPTETERADARRLFREIGETFNVNRKKSKTAAYAAYRHDLMANLDTLIMGGAIDLKEVTTVITNLEQYTKETEAESTETPATILGRWLRMDATETAGLEAKEELIDANDQLVVEEEEEEIDEAVEDA